MTLGRLLLPLLFCLPLAAIAEAPVASSSTATSMTPAGTPQPFTARYRLEVKGWPGTYVDHRLTREGSHWQSLMEAGIRIARGGERSRFLVDGEAVQALHYASGYSLLGVGGDYRLSGEALAYLPDRQTALFMLSRRVIEGQCVDTPCRVRYLDHKGREETLQAHLQGVEPITLPAGTFQSLAVEAVETDNPDRLLVFHFHPEVPGLLLSADYHRDGERKSHMSLSELTLTQ